MIKTIMAIMATMTTMTKGELVTAKCWQNTVSLIVL